jgi:hypothetical protein
MPGARSGWSRPLSHTITLKDETVLATLNDARTLIQQRFAHVIDWQGATKALMAAAEGGRPEDIAFATAKIERMLSGRDLL